MNKMLLYAVIAAVALCAIVLHGCKEEEDHDLIVGKWRNMEVVMDINATACQLQSYIEFSDYVYRINDRKRTDVNYISLGTNCTPSTP